MYKQIGFQFESLGEEDVEGLHFYMRALVDYYNGRNMRDSYSAPGERRNTYRAQVNLDIDDDLHAEIWVLHDNRFRKCLIKDISETGAGVVLPFKDRFDILTIDRPFTTLIELGKSNSERDTYRTIICRSTVKYSKSFEPPNPMVEILSNLNSLVHPNDKGFYAEKRQGATLDYSKVYGFDDDEDEEEEEVDIIIEEEV